MLRKKNVLIGIVAGLGTVAVVGLGAGTYSAISKQNQALENVQLALHALAQQQATASNGSGDLESSVERAIMAMQERETEERRASLFAGYEKASPDWDGGKWLYGNPEARFTLVEYADTECTFCKRFHGTPKGIVDASNGNVNWEYQHLTVMGERSVIQAQAAECIGEQLGNQGFWVYLGEIYQRTSSNGQGAGDLRALAAEVGADTTEFDRCVASGQYIEDIQAATASARAMGITGTPATVVVDNYTGETQLLGGAQPTEAFVQSMRQMMQRDS